MDHPAEIIRRREDGSIDTGLYIDRGNKLHAEEIKNWLGPCLGLFRALWPLHLRQQRVEERETFRSEPAK